jgi:C4-dicarboxylate-specific signal transduction histidine kinase
MTIGFVITFVLILFMAWSLYLDKSETKRALTQIEKVENIRLQLNEFYSDLTTLLRIQLINPSAQNYQSYQKVIQSLQVVMKDAKVFASRNDALPIYNKLVVLQKKILGTQNQALTLMHLGKTNAVEVLLLNPAYHNLEVQYAATVLQLINANSSYQYWLTLCNDLLMYQNYQTSLMYLLNTNNQINIQSNYHVYHARLSQLLYQATNAANPIIDIKPFQQSSVDYQRINQLNQVIFKDLSLHLGRQAQAILLSSEYKKLRGNYNKQIEAASQQIKILIQKNIQSASYTHDIIAISLLIIIIVFLFLWIYIFRMIDKWKNKLMQANAILDKKVERRTKKLIEEIRAHKEAEKQKGQLESVLHQNQKLHSVGILAAGIAHDFNNLLAIILANAESLDIEKPDNKEAQQSLIDATKEAGYLTKQLLTFARKTPQKKDKTNLNNLILKTISLLEPSLPKNIAIYHELDKEDLMVEVDANQVTQVLLNIAINAKDAMPDEGMLSFKSFRKESDELSLDSNQKGPWACITISDTGTGIAAEDLPYIFDPFFTKKDIDKGTGLGLATAYGIMQQHKGSIRAISNKEGTEFTLLFPIKG